MSTAIDTEALQQSKHMRKLVSVAAGMAGLLFGLDIGGNRWCIAIHYRPIITHKPNARMDRKFYDVWCGYWFYYYFMDFI